MSLLPSRPDAEPAEDAGPRVIGLDDDAADDVLAALSSGTARSLLAALHEEPAPPSELAERCDTSLQNVQYHLEKLETAGAVEVVETAYSEKGREMDVYAPADRPLVVFAGDEDEGSTLRTALKRLLGAVGVLGLASLLIQATLGRFALGFGGAGGDGADRAPDLGDGGGGGAPSGAPTDDSVEFQGGGSDNATTGGDGGATATPMEDTPTPDATGRAPSEAEETVAPDATETVAETATEAAQDTTTEVATQVTTTEAARTGVESATAGLPPGLVFFAGGLFVIAVVAGVWYLNRR